MFESTCQDQFLGTFQMCQRKIHCLISLCLVPIFNLVSNPLLHSIFHEMVIYLLSHLFLFFFFSWNVCFGSYLGQFQSAVLFYSQNVFILCWVTGGSFRVSWEKCFRTQVHHCMSKPRHCLCLLSLSWSASTVQTHSAAFSVFSFGFTRWGVSVRHRIRFIVRIWGIFVTLEITHGM